ncbi:hypothetical protein BH11MYX4_BH11MYX4_56490 [soil metagenome]
MSADRTISKEDVALVFTSALGPSKSDDIVTAAARSLGIPRPKYTSDEVRAIFGVLVRSEGLVGVIARFAMSRGDVDRLVSRTPQRISAEPPLRSLPPALRTAPPPARLVAQNADLLPLLTPSLGAANAREAVAEAAARCGVDLAPGLSRSGALRVLDELARVDGIVGVVARFAKARFLLLP